MRLVARIVAAFLALGLSAAPSFAQGYPNKPVRVVVGFAAGGPSDVIARIVSQKLSEHLGHSFYVENIGGAGSNTASAQVARAPADGYTLLAISTGFMVNMSLYAKVPYDAVKDFAPVTLICYSPNVVVGAPLGAGENRSRAARSHQGQSRQVLVRGSRHRLDAASLRRTVSPDVQPRFPARAVHRRGSGDPVDARRAHAGRLHGAAARACRTRRTASCACSASRPTSASRRCRTCRPSPSRGSPDRTPTR